MPVVMLYFMWVKRMLRLYSGMCSVGWEGSAYVSPVEEGKHLPFTFYTQHFCLLSHRVLE